MRTLILCLCLVVWQLMPAQPFFIDAEPTIVQNSDSTYSWFVNGDLIHIDQPKDVVFSWNEVLSIKSGQSVYREKHTNHENYFSLEAYPFFYTTNLVAKNEYRLSDDGVTVSQTQYEDRDPFTFAFFFEAGLLVIAFLVSFIREHKSVLSFVSIGIATIFAVLGSCYFGWWGYGIGLALIAVAGLWDGDWFRYYDAQDFWPAMWHPLLWAAVCLPLPFVWDDRVSQILLGFTETCIIATFWVVGTLIFLWATRSPKEQEQKSGGVGYT